jgi:hypothetical protein
LNESDFDAVVVALGEEVAVDDDSGGFKFPSRLAF